MSDGDASVQQLSEFLRASVGPGAPS